MLRPPTDRQWFYNSEYNKHRSLNKAAKANGVNYSTVRAAVKRCQEYQEKIGGSAEPETGKDNIKLEEEFEGPNRNIVSSSHEIRTLDQLLKYCRVDLDIWEVVKYVENSWGSEKNKNFQVKAWLSKRTEGDLTVEEFREEFKKAVAEHIPVYEPVKRVRPKKNNAAEISIHDLHFGSLCWKPETGQDYDIKIAQQVFSEAVEALIDEISPKRPEKIVFPIGSDFFNVNSKLNMTSAGTAQDEDSRWQKTFLYGGKMVIRAVDRLRLLAPVELVVIPGNHDEERSFYLGEYLSAWFRNDREVNVDNAPTMRKYWSWGKCLVGFCHGDAEVKGTLPLIMATEVPELWSSAEFREWHTGHLHHKATKSYDYGTEIRGVRERILPGLAATDSWHKKKGYDGLRSAEAYIWNKEGGNTADFMYNPPKTL